MLEVKDYKKGDETEIINLFKKAFNQDLSYKAWKWNYDENIYGEKYIKLMWDTNILAGHYAVLPTKLKIYDNYFSTGLSMTTMTSPDYKKRGIFVTLAKALYEDNYNKLPIIYGFPNNNSLHGFVKYLDWEHALDIPMYKCTTHSVNSEDINENIKQVNELDEKVNDLFDVIHEKYDIIVERSKDYLNWRYKSHPENKYYYLVCEEENRYLGYCIYKTFDDGDNRSCDLVDIIAVDNNMYEKLVLSLINIMHKEGINSINSWFTNKETQNISKKLGFEPTEIITHFGFMINCDFVKRNDIDFDKWYITMGDSDVF